MSEGEIGHIIRQGAFFMPAFSNIDDSILIKLSHYVKTGSFRDSVKDKSEN